MGSKTQITIMVDQTVLAGIERAAAQGHI